MPRATILVILLLFFLAFGTSPAQQQPMPPIAPPPQQPDNGTHLPSDMQQRMEKEANKQRQAELKRDTDTLLKLSTELKDYVDKTNENIMSVDVIKKADEIEKLAHKVKTKMRGDNLPPSLPPAQ